MTLKKNLLVLGTLVLATSAGGSASAREIYPGLSCQPRLGVDAVNVNTYYSDITNVKGPINGNQSVQVMCPIVRKNLDGTAPVRVFARIRNQNAAGGSNCQIFAFNWRGEDVRVGNSVTVSGANNFQGVTLNGPTNHAGGTVQMLCTLSRNSQVVNYYVEE
jgi:hypothetical protein